MALAYSSEITSTPKGQATAANSLPVVLNSDTVAATSALQTAANTKTDATNAAIGAPADTPATSNTGAFSLIALVKRFISHYLAPKTTYGALISVSGDNTVIAAPAAGQEIVITALRTQNTTDTATSVLIKKGAADINPLRVRCPVDGSGLSDVYGPANAIRLGDATAFVLNLSAAEAHGVSIIYYLANTSTGLPV